jgi:single-strand DNA-binding protein
MGNLGADPDKKILPDGTVLVNFSIACSEKWKDKATGELKESTEWVRAVVFGRRAEVIAEHFKKGNQIYVQGKMRTRSYEKDGVKHYATEILVNEFQFCGQRSGGQNDERAGQQAAAYGHSAMPDPSMDFDDDIPF